MSKYAQVCVMAAAALVLMLAGFACSGQTATTTSNQPATTTAGVASTTTHTSTTMTSLPPATSTTAPPTSSTTTPSTSTIITMTAPPTTITTTSPPTTSTTPPPTTTVAAKNIVDVVDYAFIPSSITVPAGAQVTWINQSMDDHTVTSDTPGIFADALPAGTSVTIIFNVPGTYYYHCSIHPGMTGVVIVT